MKKNTVAGGKWKSAQKTTKQLWKQNNEIWWKAKKNTFDCKLEIETNWNFLTVFSGPPHSQITTKLNRCLIELKVQTLANQRQKHTTYAWQRILVILSLS